MICIYNFLGHEAKIEIDSYSQGKTFQDWLEDLRYLVKNKSYLLSSIAFTLLTFFTGGLSWWGPHYIEYALDYRNASGFDISSDPEKSKYKYETIF